VRSWFVLSAVLAVFCMKRHTPLMSARVSVNLRTLVCAGIVCEGMPGLVLDWI